MFAMPYEYGYDMLFAVLLHVIKFFLFFFLIKEKYLLFFKKMFKDPLFRYNITDDEGKFSLFIFFKKCSFFWYVCFCLVAFFVGNNAGRDGDYNWYFELFFLKKKYNNNNWMIVLIGNSQRRSRSTLWRRRCGYCTLTMSRIRVPKHLVRHLFIDDLFCWIECVSFFFNRVDWCEHDK